MLHLVCCLCCIQNNDIPFNVLTAAAAVFITGMFVKYIIDLKQELHDMQQELHDRQQKLIVTQLELYGTQQESRDLKTEIRTLQQYKKMFFLPQNFTMPHEPEIANVQNYYKNVLLTEDWEEEAAHSHVASAQVSKRDQQKAIPGRYIVMFAPETTDRHLDRTMELLSYADEKSRRNRWDLRAADFGPIRHVGKGFTATLSSNVVRIVSG